METTGPTSEPKQIYQLMPRLMAAVGAIPRGKLNKEQHYRYRSIDDIQNALQPALIENGVALELHTGGAAVESWTEDRPRGGGQRHVFHATLTVRLLFTAPDGSAITAEAPGEGLDYAGDKATAKALVSAWKYAVTLGLCIPLEDTVEPDAEAPAEATPTTAPRPADPPRPARSLRGAAAVDPYSGRPSDPSTPDQHEALRQLARAVGMTPDELQQVAQKRGAETIEQLTHEQAASLAGKLRALRTEQEAADFF